MLLLSVVFIYTGKALFGKSHLVVPMLLTCWRLWAQLLEWCVWNSHWWVSIVLLCFIALQLHLLHRPHWKVSWLCSWTGRAIYWFRRNLRYTHTHHIFAAIQHLFIYCLCRWWALWYLWKVHQPFWERSHCSSGLAGSLRNLSSDFLQLTSPCCISKDSPGSVTWRNFWSLKVCKLGGWGGEALFLCPGGFI